MALLWHILGLERPLVAELAEISRQQDTEFFRRRTYCEANAEATPSTSLQQRRHEIERAIQALRHETATSPEPSCSDHLPTLIGQKREAIAQLQTEVTELERALARSGTSKKSASDLLESQLRRERKKTSSKKSSA